MEPQQGLTPSLIDRLIDPEAAGTRWHHGYTVEQMFVAVQRDLEELLNTRQSHIGLSAEYKELHNSVYAYGLPDLVSLSAATGEQRQAIGRVLEETVRRFEPRLKDVRAQMIQDTDGKERKVTFHITAQLNVDPAPEVAFDTVLELTTGRFSVQSGGD